MKKLLQLFIICLAINANSQVTQISNFDNNDAISNYNTDQVASIGNKYIFVANTEATGNELWISNGSADGPTLIKDQIEGSDGARFSNFVAGDDKVYFFSDVYNGTQLWWTDGENVTLTKVVNGGEIYNTFDDPVIYKGEVYYTYYTPTSGEELWKSDGSTGGTKLVKDIVNGSGSSGCSSYFVFDGKLYFFAEQSGFDGRELWISDGLESGTQMIKLLNEKGSSNVVTALDHDEQTIYFTMQRGFSDDLWISDGTSTGTKFVLELEERVNELKVLNGKAYFTLDGGENKDDLWMSDGTASGTKIVEDFTSNGPQNYPFSLTEFESNLYLFAYDGGDLFFSKLDPATDEITKIKEFSSSFTDVEQFIINAGDELLFIAREDFSFGYEIYTSKGTEATTSMLVDLNPFSGSSYAVDFRMLESGDLIFKAESSSDNRELFRYKKSNYVPFYGDLSFENDIICNEDTVNLIAQGFGGEPPYSYLWNTNNAVDNKLINAYEGEFTVTITDLSGQSVVRSIEVEFPPFLYISEVEVVPASGGNADGSAEVIAEGGVSPYTYLWDNGASATLIENLISNTYTVRVTDSLGCEKELEVLVPMTSSTSEAEKNIEIYPSIVIDEVIINSNGEAIDEILIYNATGQLVKWIQNPTTIINIKDLTNGLHLFKVLKNNQLIKTERIIKI